MGSARQQQENRLAVSRASAQLAANPLAEFQNVGSYSRFPFGLPEKQDESIDVYVVFDQNATFPSDLFRVEKFGRFLVLHKRH